MKKWFTIIIGSLLVIILVAVVWEYIYLKSTIKEEVYILRQGFKGIVLIAYDQQNGLEDVKKDGILMYKISKNGVLKLKRKSPIVLSQSSYYFEDDQGKKIEFYYCFPPCEDMKNNPDQVFAFGKSNGGFENEGEQVEMTTFLVGSSHDTDSLNKADEIMNPIEILKRN